MKEKIRKIIFVIALITFIISIGILGWYYYNKYKREQDINLLKELVVDSGEISPTIANNDDDTNNVNDNIQNGLDYYIIDGQIVQKKFKDIYLKNTDFIGWLNLSNSNIDYPVVYTPNDVQYYLRKDFDKNYSIAGTLFIGDDTDIEKPSENVIIYGHNMNDNTMFHDISNFEDEKYYQKHKYIEFDTLTRSGKYEVIAAFRTTVNMNNEQFDKFVDNCLKNTPYKTVNNVDYDEKLITLSTCAYHNTYGRFVVIAKLIEETKVDTSKPPIQTINTKQE